jgi:alkylhydroperoxidase/carboxymuconolactone decarboxylase family protein YurZ
MRQKYLIVFAFVCSNKRQSEVKILEKLRKFGATREEITKIMMSAAWTGRIQHFTDFSAVILKEMDKLGC